MGVVKGLIYWSSQGSFSADDFAILPGYVLPLMTVLPMRMGMAGSICCCGHQQGVRWFWFWDGFSENSVTFFETDYLTKLFSVDLDDDGHSELISYQYLDATSGSYDVSSSVWWAPFSENLDMRVEVSRLMAVAMLRLQTSIKTVTQS